MEGPPIEPEPVVNVDQARAWDGEEGDHWATHAERYDAAMAEYGEHLAAGARITAREAVLDIGCGNGVSTREAAHAAPDGHALGIDLSSSMLERARAAAEAEGLTNVEFRKADAQVHRFAPDTFDVAISRFGVMFFTDPVAAFANVASALVPGGRLAFVAWKTLAENEWFSEIGRALAAGRTMPPPKPGAPSPFGLSDTDYTRDVLTRAGFSDIAFETAAAKYYTGTDADDAFTYLRGLGFTRLMLQDLDNDTAARALDALRSTIEAHETERGVIFDSVSWLVTASRT